MQAFGSKNMGFDECIQRLQHGCARPDLVGQRRHAQIDALALVALALPVQRLMLAELLEQDHGKKVWSGKAARRDMERRRWLGDRFAIPARELLAHRLDHLPPARDHFQRLGDVFAQLRQFDRAAARAAFGSGNDDALARQILGKRPPCRPTVPEQSDLCRLACCLLGGRPVLARCRFEILQLQFHLLNQPGFAFRAAAVEFAP